MVEIGQFSDLEVVKIVDFGVYLDAKELGDILLPKKYVPENTDLADIIKVFIYLDSEDFLIATTLTPFAKVGEFAYLEVINVNDTGAFLDWGLTKDLFVPFREQKVPMKEGQKHIVRVYLDEQSQRIAASARLDKFLKEPLVDVKDWDEVDIMMVTRTDIGFKAIVNDTAWGVLYENEVFRTLYKGEKSKAYIKKIREDGKVDLSLTIKGYEQVKEFVDELYEYIVENDGILGLTEKSSPEEIKDKFGVSKKVFKKAIGNLLKNKKVVLNNGEIFKA